MTASSKQFRLDIVELCCSLQRSVRPMMQEACREGHRARVAECGISATYNSLKSQRARNLKSPISNDRAITSKLCIRSRPTAVKKSLGLQLMCIGQFPIAPAAPPVHHRPRLRALALLERRPHQRVEGHVIPASENLVWAYRCQLKNRRACESFCHITGLHCATAVPSLGCAERSSREAVWRGA